MPVHKPGKIIKGDAASYEIITDLNQGAMAIAYSAKDLTSGETVFLKEYISPRPLKEWYSGWVNYQQEMRRRIDRTDLKHRTLKILDFFETSTREGKTDRKYRRFFQVFEFITEGSDLRERLDTNPAWEVRQQNALIFVALLERLHAERIVHTDLKPENVFVKDQILADGKTVGVIKLIDMDFSVLSDQQPPWHGHNGYVGTPGYLSPEHLRGEIPTEASDVFTAGLILYEVLAGTHPYDSSSEEDVLAHRAQKPRFFGPFENGNDERIGELLHQMLSPNASARPSLSELKKELGPKRSSARIGTGGTRRPPPPPVEPPEAPTSTEEAPRDEAKARRDAARAEAERIAAAKSTAEAEEKAKRDSDLEAWRIKMRGIKKNPPDVEPLPTNLVLTINGNEIPLGITRNYCGQEWIEPYAGADARFWAKDQFDLVKENNAWYVVPKDTPNDTMLNNRKVTAKTALNDGDVLGVGKESKGIVKTPLSVRIVEVNTPSEGK
jgi:serine/threonine protein kinase